VDRSDGVVEVTVEQLHECEPAACELDVQQPTHVSQDSVFRPVDVAWLLWGERRFLAQLTAGGLIAFTLLAFLLPKRYTATAHLMPPDFNTTSSMMMALPALSSGGTESGGGAAGGGSLMGLANKLLGFNSSGELFIGVLQSRTIEDDIVKRFGLMKLYSAKYPEDARVKLEGVTEIKAEAKTGILSLSVEDKDPARAAAMAQAYVEDLNQVLATVNTSAAHRERVFIEQRRDEVKKDLDDSAKQFSEFASQNTAIDIPEQAKAMVTAAADLQAQLISAQSMLRGLQQIYTDNNARVRQVKGQVAELKQQLTKLGGKGITPANGSVLSEDELYPSIRQLPLLGVRYLDLFRRNKINEAVYELLSKQYEIAKLEEARDVPTAQVLDPAVVPQKKTSPHRTWILLGGVCFSFSMGVVWVLGGAYWQRTDPQLPWRVLVQEVIMTCKANSWDSAAGLRVRARLHSLRTVVLQQKQRPDSDFILNGQPLQAVEHQAPQNK
jgi:uncharacterized protein involved in exopolysaccharide biosynthesis